MLVVNATRAQIEAALAQANEVFSGNLRFKRLDYAGLTRKGEDKWTVTLTVEDSASPGARRSEDGRRIASACWHAYGRFMDALPEDARFQANTAAGRDWKKPGDPWQDWNLYQSGYRYVMMPTLCECEGELAEVTR